ncbi:hypothetical protein FRC01_006250 [Tulasnella sp. 417]|nr:hypothetical protein FRC01_006250 [Tulasnella sp. 417]
MVPNRASPEQCAECAKRGRECNNMFPDCEHYRRAAPSQKGGIRQARMQQEQKYLIEYAQGLERKLAQLKASKRTREPTTKRTPSGSEATLQDILSGANSSQQAHPALLNAVYLLAISSASQTPGLTGYSSAQAESHFLAQARKGMADSIALADRLVDYLKACAIVSVYLTKKGRHLEGDGTTPGSPNTILSSTTDPLEAIDRIHVFWTFYYQDKIYAIIFGFAPALDEEVDASAVNLMSIMDGLTGYLPVATLGELFAEPGAVNGEPFSHTAFTRQIHAIRLLHQVRKLCALKRFGELAHIRVQAEGILKNSAPTSAVQDARACCTRTILLLTLIEVARASATPDWGAEIRPAIAIAESISRLKEQELIMSCVMTQYCWKFAATVLTEHQHHLTFNKAPEAEVSQISNCIERLEAAVTWAGSSLAVLPVTRNPYSSRPQASLAYGSPVRRSPS